MTTDTRAALDAAIDAATPGQADCDLCVVQLRAAITAHVEAEVARRLAAAPGVEEAITEHARVFSGLAAGSAEARLADHDPATKQARGILRAAIAADRERAVEFAVDQAAKPMARRMAAEIVTTDAMISYVVGGLRAVGLLRVGPGDLDAVMWTRLANAIDEVRRVPADLRVTVTPDDARRMAADVVKAVNMYSRDQAPAEVERILLRALGVEA